MNLNGNLVFASGRSTDFDIWTLDLTSGSLRQLTHGRDLNDTPRWSPDGSKIAFISIGADLIASLEIMDSDGGNRRRRTTNVHSQHPSWSPDGNSIVFTANAENGEEIEVCVYDLSADKCEILFKREGHETEPSFSPDGTKLLFSSVDPKSDVPFSHRDTELWEYNLNTKSESKICSHPARDFCPVYSPDSSHIAFVSHRNARSEEEYLQKLVEIKSRLNPEDRTSIDQTIHDLQSIELDSDIYVVDANGGNLRKMTDNEGPDVGVRWSPCSKYLIYSAAPKGEHVNERIKVIEVDTGRTVPLDYDRTLLMKEINADPQSYLDNNIFMRLVPNFIEKPLKMLSIGSFFWGEERQPDWTYAAV